MATEVKASPSWWSLTAVILCIGIIAWLAFTATSKTDTETFTKGASKTESALTVSPTANYYPLSLGCAPIMRLQDFTVPEGEKNNPYVNARKKK